jgi:metal-responsive CopG/Arc/MetJ family transcriptional regulator
MKKILASKRKVKVSVVISPDLAKRVDRMAKATGKNRSETVQGLIEDAIDDQETTASAVSNPTIMNAIVAAFAKPEVMRALMNQMRQEVTDEQLGLFAKAMEVGRVVVQQPEKKK